MVWFKKIFRGVSAFWRTVNDEQAPGAGVQSHVQQAHRVEEPLFDDPFGPLNQRESHIVVAPLFEGDVEFASSSKQVEQHGSDLTITSQVRSVYRGEDGVPLMDVGQMYQCPSCQSVVSQDSLFVCERCKLKFCRGPGCRNEVEVDGVRLDVCSVCLKQYYKPLFSGVLARKIFDY